MFFLSRYKTRLPKQWSICGRTTRLHGDGTDTSSAKQQPTRGISTRSHGSGSDSSSARGSQGPLLTCDNIPVLIQEVVQLLTKRSSLRHSEQSSMENPSDQPPSQRYGTFNPLRKQYTFYRWHSWSGTASTSSPLWRPPYPTEYPEATRPVPDKWAICHIYCWLISNYSTMYNY